MKEHHPISNPILLLVAFLLVIGCDQTFEPLQENNKYHFSIYGTLDAEKDTQWIRIGVPRENINETPDPAGITVTLEDVETGQTAVMQDSLFASRDLLNYWTTIPLKNEHTYRIIAERDDGKSSVVTVTIPEELPTPIVWINNNPSGYMIYIDDSVEHIADLQTKWYVLISPQTERVKRVYTFNYRNKLKHTGAFGGAYFTLVRDSEERRFITESNAGADIAVLHRQFFVAAGGPEWDDNISSINDLEYFLDGTASNVENGLGYVVGTDSKLVPYFTCQTPDSSDVIPCEPEEPFW
ncbi:hypothetical protein [Rhodohalobacter sulfatireducens]|uniref:DUF4249 family protein n=1 Tax=Rhodohalobacter sulfatireducens TaxID=2911366 RepID=A0ABS9K9Y5_9BACT|nr:hypothetical protein [Rhodohalobacter sulfatireducens]MCG2587664.1 hypothetical protein [Rhodohalobacter sulfatireducens]